MVAAGDPLKIVLFGSRARGEARAVRGAPRRDSDLDLLVLVDSDLPRHKRSARYRKALLGLFPSKDIVVWTPQEVEDWEAVPHAFVTSFMNMALREGAL